MITSFFYPAESKVKRFPKCDGNAMTAWVCSQSLYRKDHGYLTLQSHTRWFSGSFFLFAAWKWIKGTDVVRDAVSASENLPVTYGTGLRLCFFPLDTINEGILLNYADRERHANWKKTSQSKSYLQTSSEARVHAWPPHKTWFSFSFLIHHTWAALIWNCFMYFDAFQ